MAPGRRCVPWHRFSISSAAARAALLIQWSSDLANWGRHSFERGRPASGESGPGSARILGIHASDLQRRSDRVLECTGTAGNAGAHFSLADDTIVSVHSSPRVSTMDDLRRYDGRTMNALVAAEKSTRAGLLLRRLADPSDRQRIRPSTETPLMPSTVVRATVVR